MKRKIYPILLLAFFVTILLTACAHTHVFEAWEVARAASCGESGIEIRTCSCGQVETQYIPRTEHTPGEWVVVTEPACTAPGLKQLTCSDCKQVIEVASIPAADHTPGDWIVVTESTCTAEGLMHQLCAACDLVLQSSPIPVEDHSAGEWVTVADATCTANGFQQQSCSDCQLLLQTAAVPAKHHATRKWEAVLEPTCTAEGIHKQVCVDCGMLLRIETVSVKGHTAGRWIVDVEATATKEGIKRQVCADCAATLKTEAIPVLSQYLVILDAGHGGEDPGATVAGVLEKDINLQIVLKMKELLEAQGISVILTRTDDVYIGLDDRAVFANSLSANLFVSIHCNSYAQSTSASGFEIFYYQKAQAKTIADAILSDLEKTGQVKIRSVKTAEYYVLKYTNMPAVLLEMGFLTNEAERQKLCTDEYQQMLAETITSSIIEYLT